MDVISPQRILLVNFDNLGDLVFTSGLYNKLRKAYPKSHIAVWCKEYTKEAALLMPKIDEVYAADPFWDIAPGRKKGSWLTFLRTALKVRAKKYDLTITTSKQWRAVAATRIMGAKMRIGFACKKSRWLLTHGVEKPQKNTPAVQALDTLTHALNLPGMCDSYQLDATSFAPVRYQLAQKFDLNRLVVLHPFAGDLNRCWPLMQWYKFANYLRRNGCHIVWIGQDRELNVLRSMLDPIHHHELCDHLSATTGIAGILANASLVIGHDSGPLHLAHSFGTSVLGLYLPGEPNRTHPQGVAAYQMLTRKCPNELQLTDVVQAFESLRAEKIRAKS